MNDFKSQLSGLLATLQKLPDGEQQTALALLQSSLACQASNLKTCDYVNLLSQKNEPFEDNIAFLPLSSNRTYEYLEGNSATTFLSEQCLQDRQDFSKITTETEASQLRQKVDDVCAQFISDSPSVTQNEVHDSLCTNQTDNTPVIHSLQSINDDNPSTFISDIHESVRVQGLIHDADKISRMENSSISSVPPNISEEICAVDLKVTFPESKISNEVSSTNLEDTDISDDEIKESKTDMNCKKVTGDACSLVHNLQKDARVMQVTSTTHLPVEGTDSSSDTQLLSSDDSIVNSKHQKHYMSVIQGPNEAADRSEKVDKSQQCIPYSDEFQSNEQEKLNSGELHDSQQLAVSLMSNREGEFTLVTPEDIEQSYQESLDVYHLKNAVDHEKGAYIMVPVLEKVRYLKVDVDLDDVNSICLADSCDRVDDRSFSTSKSSVSPHSLELPLEGNDRESNKDCDADTDNDIESKNNCKDLYSNHLIKKTATRESNVSISEDGSSIHEPKEDTIFVDDSNTHDSPKAENSCGDVENSKEKEEGIHNNLCQLSENLSLKAGNGAPSPNLQPVSCRSCKKELTDVSLFIVHQGQCEGYFTCTYCQAKFLHKVTYVKHVQGHTRNSCPKCPQNFCNHKKLKAHMKADHNVDIVAKTYSCSFCPRTFMKRMSLYYHFKIHATNGEIVCRRCGKFCKDKESFDSHMDEHSRASNFHCRICTAIFTRRQQYDDHVKHHKKNKCELCEQPFTNKKALVRHCRMVHNSFPQNIPPEPQYRCDKCPRVFNRPSLLKQHQLVHT
ncbi:hypothetical protein SK128_004978, partial [Halocaridina rubra]